MDYLCANRENVLQLVLFLEYGEKYAKKSPCFKHFTVLQKKAFVDRFYFFMFAFCISHTSICIYPPPYSSLKKWINFIISWQIIIADSMQTLTTCSCLSSPVLVHAQNWNQQLWCIGEDGYPWNEWNYRMC